MVILKFLHDVKPKGDVYFYINHTGLFPRKNDIFVYKKGLFFKMHLGSTEAFPFRCFITEKSLFVSNFLREVSL